MADVGLRIRKMIERELIKKPDISNQALQDKAAKIDAAVSKMGKRQFNARYPLQVKRKMGPGKPATTTVRKPAGKKRVVKRSAPKKAAVKEAAAAPRKAKATRKPARRRAAARKRVAQAAPAVVETPVLTPTLDRDAVRAAFMSFASDLSGAEHRKDVVKVLANLDRYVNRVAKAIS